MSRETAFAIKWGIIAAFWGLLALTAALELFLFFAAGTIPSFSICAIPGAAIGTFVALRGNRG